MELQEIKPGLFFGRLQEGDDFSDFDCGHKDTNEFLKDDALEYQKQNLTTTYVVKDRHRKVVAFIALATGAIKTNISPKVVLPNVEIRQYPCMKIGQLGVTKERQGEDLGGLLVLFAIKIADELKNAVGCRFVQVDSYHERTTFYQRFAFKKLIEKTKGKTIPMYYTLRE